MEEENKDERQPLNNKHVIHYVDVSKNHAQHDDILNDPLVSQLPKAMLKYVKTPEQHQAYDIHDIYIYIYRQTRSNISIYTGR